MLTAIIAPTMRASSSSVGWLAPACASALVFLLGPHAGDRVAPELLHRAVISAQSGLPGIALDHLEAAMAFDMALASLHSTAATLAVRSGDSQRAIEHLQLMGTARSASCDPIGAEGLVSEPPAEPGSTSIIASACAVEVSITSLMAGRYWSAGEFEKSYALLEQIADSRQATADQLRLRALGATLYDREAVAPSLRAALVAGPVPDPLLQEIAKLSLPADARELPAYYARLGGLMATHREWRLARAALEAALVLQPNLADARAYLGTTQERMGESGYREIWGAVLSDPSSSVTWTLLGDYWLDHGEVERSLEALQQARRLDPSNAAAAASFGSALAANGDINEASEAYLEAADLDPGRPDFWLLLAGLSVSREHAIETLGLPAARNAATLDPSNTSAFGLLGYAHVLVGEPSLGVRLLRRAIRLSPREPSAYYHLGLGYLALQDRVNASIALEAALGLDPEGEVGALSRRVLGNLAP
jgi:tetratricopeptide (TPR) repeat protein